MAQDLTLRFKVDDQGSITLDKISKSIQKVGLDTEKMSKAMQVVSVASFISIAKEAYAAGEKVYGFAKSIADTANVIERQSRIFNMSTDDLQKWSFVARMADVDIEGFGQGFKFLTRSMKETLEGSGDAKKAFDVLGISLKDNTGKVKGQQTIIMEVIGVLEKYADGVNRDSLMLAIFGRGWMSFKPLIDQGTEAIKNNREQAERLKTVLSPDLIKAGSEAEDAFKRISVQLEAGKLRLAPYAKGFAELFEGILKKANELKTWATDNPKVWGFIIGTILPWWATTGTAVMGPKELGKSEAEKAGELYLQYEEYYKRTAKPEAPSVPTKPKWEDIYGKYYESKEAQKDYMTSLAKNAEAMESTVNPQFEAFWEILKGTDIDVVKLNKDMTSYMAGVEERMKEYHYEAPVEGPWTEMGLSPAEFEYYQKTGREATKARSEWAAAYSEVSELERVWKSFGDTLSSVWSDNVSGMVKGTETFAEGFKNMVGGMGDAFISAITKMITNYLLFQNVTGQYQSGEGLLGLFGKGISSIFSPTPSMEGVQSGGQFWVNRPTPFLVGEGGQRELVTVTPESRMGAGKSGDTYVVQNYVQVTDPNTFVRIYGGAVKKLSEESIVEAKRLNKMSTR